MNTSTLVQQAQEKKYSDFDTSTKEILSQKIAHKLSEMGYFDRLSTAQGISEGETPFAKKKEEDEDSDDKDEKDSDDKDEKDSDDKDRKKNPFAKKKDNKED